MQFLPFEELAKRFRKIVFIAKHGKQKEIQIHDDPSSYGNR
jgi:hypothetical protein